MDRFLIDIPDTMRVTAVQAENMGTWRYLSETKQLEVLLTAARRGSYTLMLTTQIADCNLPYETTIGCITVQGAARQLEMLAISASPAISPQVVKTHLFTPVNAED